MRIRNNRGNFQWILQIQKSFYRLADILTNFQQTIDRTLVYSSTAWLDDIIVVTRVRRKDHEKKLFDVLKELEDAKYRASENKSELSLNKTKWLGHEIDENGIKPNKENVKAIIDLKHPETQKQLNSFSEQFNTLQNFYRDYRKEPKDCEGY